MASPPIALKVLLQQRHWQTYRIFCREYDRAARHVDEALVGTWPSRAQLHRWLSGQLKGLPYADHCQVLEKMFKGWTTAELFEPHTPDREQPNAHHETGESAPAIDATRKTNHDLDLSGTWWAAWQTWKDDIPRIDVHPLEAHQRGGLLQLDADRAVSLEEGSYRWEGELRLWDNEALIGWYHSTDGAVRSKGALYLALHPHGTYAWGRWTGMSYDGPVLTGWGAMARTEDQAHRVVRDRIDVEHP